MLHNVVKWLIFGVVVSAVPVLYSILNLFVFRGRGWDPSLVLGNGEMFIIAATLCAGGLGELLGSNDNLRTWKLLSGGACVILLIMATLSFAGVSEGSTHDPTTVVVVSLWVYGGSVVSAFLSMLLAQV